MSSPEKGLLVMSWSKSWLAWMLSWISWGLSGRFGFLIAYWMVSNRNGFSQSMYLAYWGVGPSRVYR